MFGAIKRVVFSWLVATAVVSAIAVYIQYFVDPSTALAIYVAIGLQVVIINHFFWLPVLAYLHKKRKISLLSSTVSSMAAALLGGVCIVGAVMLLLVVTDGRFLFSEPMGDEFAGYTDWTVGHVYYGRAMVYFILLWGINGIVFWRMYEKFAANK